MSPQSPKTSGPAVSVIIVHFMVEEYLERCLRSLLDQPEGTIAEILVVNNGSRRKLAFPDPRISVIENPANLGFAAACNIGLRKTRGRYRLILNPDTVVGPGSIAKSIDRMEAHAKIGILGCTLRNADGSLQPSARNFPSLPLAFLESCGLYWPMKWIGLRPPGYLRMWDHGRTRNVDWIFGAFLLIRGEAIRQIGLFDERFFIYYEEIDYCKRAKTAGWETTYFRPAEIVHFGGKSTEIDSLRNLIAFHRSQRLYWHKHFPGLRARLGIGLYFLGLVNQLVCAVLMPWDSAGAGIRNRRKIHLYFNAAKSYFK